MSFPLFFILKGSSLKPPFSAHLSLDSALQEMIQFRYPTCLGLEDEISVDAQRLQQIFKIAH
jgi:hypothetical protein